MVIKRAKNGHFWVILAKRAPQGGPGRGGDSQYPKTGCPPKGTPLVDHFGVILIEDFVLGGGHFGIFRTKSGHFAILGHFGTILGQIGPFWGPI